MNQLVVLQEIYESFSKGREGHNTIDPRSIEGSCSVQVARLLEGSKQGKIDADLCLTLADCLQDVYELKRLGDICKKAGLLELGIRCYDRALSTTVDNGVKAVLLNNLGQVYAQSGDLGRAVAYYRKAVKRFECIGDKSGMAHVQGNLGSAYRRAYGWDKAIEYCYKSLRAFEELEDDLGSAQMTGSLGRVYADMGELELASRYFEKSLKAFQKLGDRRSEAWVLNRLGKISAYKSLDVAIKYYNQSLSIFEDLGLGQGSGVVLSNLGRAYLDRGEASMARDCLEPSLKILRKETKPAYYNASAWLAATYSFLAKDNQWKANAISSAGVMERDQRKVELLGLASQYYSRAADRYGDIIAASGIELADIGMAGSVAVLLSILEDLQAEHTDEEAVKIADRAISNLEEMAMNDGEELEQIDAIKRTLTGMRCVWSQGLPNKEPWKLARSIADSIEYFVGGVPFPGGTGAFIDDALRCIKCAIEEEQQRRDSTELLNASASLLRQAETRFRSSGTGPGFESATWLGNAATLIERLISAQADRVKTTSSNINELFNYRTHRKAILQIGWVLVMNALPAIDRTVYVYSWDESMNLVENRPAGQLQQGSVSKAKQTQERPISDSDALLEDDAFDEMEGEPIIECTSEPYEMNERSTILEMDAESALFADGPVVEVIPEGSSLVPTVSHLVYSSSDPRALVERNREPGSLNKAYRFQPGSEVLSNEGRDPELADVSAHSFNAVRGQLNDLEEPGRAGAAWESQDFSASPAMENAERRYAFGNGLFTRSNVINLVKALAVVVLVLLAIDVILYLI
jgi:tetratricopeptide (TPR) repeat protein